MTVEAQRRSRVWVWVVLGVLATLVAGFVVATVLVAQSDQGQQDRIYDLTIDSF